MDSNRTNFQYDSTYCRWLLANCLGLACLLCGNIALAQSDADPDTSGKVAAETTAEATDSGDSAETAEELFGLAASHYSNQQWELATEHFQKLARRHPDHENARLAGFYVGESLMQLDRYADAEQAFRDYLDESPSEDFVQRAEFRVAECQYLGGRRDQALAGFEKFLTTHSGDSLAEFALPYLGELQFEAGDVAAARTSYEQALDQFPGSNLSDKCRLGLAQSLQRLGQYQEAERFYRFLFDQPDNELGADALLASARMWASRGNWDRCRERLEELETHTPATSIANQAAYLSAKAYMAEQKWIASWEILEPLTDQPWNNSQFARVGLDAALVALRLDKRDAATALIDRVRESTGEPSLLEFAGALEIDLASARKDVSKLESLVGRFRREWPESAWLARGIESLARELYAAGDYQKSADRYAQLVELAQARAELQPNIAAWCYLQSLSLIGCGEYSRASQQLQNISFGDDQTFQGVTAFAMGTSLCGEGKHAEAIEHYQQYLKLVPEGEDVIRCHADLATAQVRSGKLDEALESISSALPDGKSDPAVLAACETIAESALTQKRLDTARKYFRLLAASGHPVFAGRGATGLIWAGDQDSMQDDQVDEAMRQADPPMVLEALLAQAQRLQANNQHHEARQLLERIIRLGPDTSWAVDASVRLAVTLLKTKSGQNRQRAEQLLTTFLQEHEDHALVELALYELAWLHHDDQQWEPARQAFLKIVNSFPDSRYWADSLYRTGTLSHRLDNDRAAGKYFRQLIESRPDDRLVDFAHYGLGEIANQDGDWPLAIRHFEKVLSGQPDQSLLTPATYWIAECYYQNGQTAIAERHFRALNKSELQNQKTAAAVVLRLAQCPARRDDWSQVREILDAAQQDSPELVQGYQFDYLRARVHMSQAKFRQARKLLQTVLADPDARATQTAAMSQWLIGESWFHQEDFPSALRAYLLVDSLYDFPEWRALALLQAAKCYWRMDQPEPADKTIERLIASFPQSGVVLEARQFRNQMRREAPRTDTIPATFSKPKQ